MLTKNDLKAIKQIIDGSFDSKFAGAFAEGIAKFWNEEIAPFLEAKFKENDEDHEEIFAKLDRNRDEHDRILINLENHEKRIGKVEKSLQIS